jgi:hypothetical protein
MANYKRDDNGMRLKAGSIQTYKPVDMMGEGEYPVLINVRGYVGERLKGRATQGTALFPAAAGAVHSIRRLNDSTPAGPLSGYALVYGAAGSMYINATLIATGFSSNPVSLIPFRPNASVQPWMYCGDSDLSAHIVAPAFNCPTMIKVRSDGLTYKWGIQEPSAAPDVTTASTTTTGSAALNATSYPWTNVGGANAAFNYGHTSGADGTAPLIIATPVYGSTVTISITGTATVNSTLHSPGDAGPNSVGYPGAFLPSPSIVLGAWTNGVGTVISVVNIGTGTTISVPTGATRLQIGVDSNGNTFSSNSGSFAASWTVETAAIATVVSTLGDVTAYVWGDSPHSGPVASYIWKNPNDGGSGLPRSIGDAKATVTNNSWEMDSTPENGTVPVQWNTLDSTGAISGQIVLFSPAYESEGYQDFNACITGSLFIPAAGTYTFTFKNKDQIMVGIGGGATVGSTILGRNGQTVSVVDRLPLMYVSTPNGSGGAVTQNVSVTFPATGAYDVEIDWDYWFHTGRVMQMTVNGATIPPLPITVRKNVSYAYKYRNSQTGAVSNPSPLSDLQSTPVLDNVITPAWSPDPQVDKVDYYRQDEGLANYTYVGTGPNTNPPTSITDTLSDAAAATNPIMTFDDFEPFPSIDLPKSGTVNVSGGVITNTGGDPFNVRWLPGTIIQIGSPTQLAYTLITRPSSSVTMVIPGVPDGTNLVYNIAEPILAAEPLPSLWGPTDNTAYMFGCYDPLRPGTLYFTKGNTPDSAPDTNQIEVTSPSEPLMNGCIVNGYSMVFSSERAWMCKPNFTTALATVSGVQGQPFNLQLSISDRGLYIRSALCVAGGKTVYFRAKYGIYGSPGGNGSTSLTDAFLYNLFPHEGYTPSPVTVAGYTIYPPDDSQPEKQRLSFATGYLYYDYASADNVRRTLVLDAIAGWVVDVYEHPTTVHALEEGPNANDTLVGCADGTVRRLAKSATETAQSIVVTPDLNFGDARGYERIGDIFMRAQIDPTNPVSIGLWTNQFTTAVTGYAPTSLTGTNTLAEYIVDFTDGMAREINDIGVVFSWNTQAVNTYLDLWQPSIIELPESTKDRPTDWDNLGDDGNKFIQGLLLEANSFGAPKNFAVETDDGVLHTPVEVPAIFNGQQIKSFTFNPPFTGHLVRIVSTDNVPWRLFNSGTGIAKWVAQPFPEASTVWTTEGTANNLEGYQHCFAINLAYIAISEVTCTLTTNEGVFTRVFPPTTEPSNLPAKIFKLMPRNKWKTVSYSFTSPQPFYLWKNLTEVWLKNWGSQNAYYKFNPFGGNSNDGAEL